jgi:hypothetical protein
VRVWLNVVCCLCFFQFHLLTHLPLLSFFFKSLVVYFSHQKNDQQGKRAAFCRHLFYNPFNKYMCPVFDLSLWIALNEEMMMSGGPLFPGSNQQIRFNKLFRSFLNEHSQLVHACGYAPDLLGFHSFHKRPLPSCPPVQLQVQHLEPSISGQGGRRERRTTLTYYSSGWVINSLG